MGGLWAVRGTTALFTHYDVIGGPIVQSGTAIAASSWRYANFPDHRPGSALPPGRGGWHHGGVDYLLAQVNIGRMREPLDSPLLADFVAALDPVNAAADTAPGFV